MRTHTLVLLVSTVAIACAPTGRTGGGGGGGGGGAGNDDTGGGGVAPGAGGDVANGDEPNAGADGGEANADDEGAIGQDDEGLDIVDDDGNDDEPAAPPQTGLDSCGDVRTCASNCADNDGDCVADCTAFGTPEAQEAFQDLLLCNAVNGCGWDDGCLGRNCRDEDVDCSVADDQGGAGPDDPDGVGGGGGDGLSCGAIFQCLEDCGDDEACSQGCARQATPAAQGQFQDLAQCLRTQCAQADGEEAFMACAEAECGGELNACFAEPGGDGGDGGDGGQLSCAGIFQCGQACPDDACLQGCIADATPGAQQQFQAIGVCLDENCADAGDDAATVQACAEENCPQQLQECFGQ